MGKADSWRGAVSPYWADELLGGYVSVWIESSFRRVILYSGAVYHDLENCTCRIDTYLAKLNHEVCRAQPRLWMVDIQNAVQYSVRDSLLVCSLRSKPAESTLSAC